MEYTGFYTFAQFIAGIGASGLCITSIVMQYKVRKKITKKVQHQQQLTIFEYFYRKVFNSRFTPVVMLTTSYFSNIFLWSATRTLEERINGHMQNTKTNFRKQLILHDAIVGIPINFFMMGMYSFNYNYIIASIGMGIYCFYSAFTGCHSRLRNGILACAPVNLLQNS